MKRTDSTGFIQTLNNMGFMLDKMDEWSLKFVESAMKAERPSLDVGCAFGIATIPAIQGGATMVANDIHEEHLRVLASQVPEKDKHRLILNSNAFPDGFEKDFGENFFSNVLISRVLHFLSGEKIEACFKTLHHILIPGGRAFIINETPYLKNIQRFKDLYEKKLNDGEKWPGEIHNFREIDERGGVNLPTFMHLLDVPVLERVSRQFNFLIKECHYVKRTNFPKDIILDGRESVGLIIQKPL